jgi:large subunit ribosomal protein L13
MTTDKNITIDAAGKSLGRLASQIASILTGKNTTTYALNIFPDVKVSVINAAKIKVAAKAAVDKKYKTFSGYPSGLREEKQGALAKRLGYSEVLWRAVNGMVPINRLRNKIMKNLIIKD